MSETEYAATRDEELRKWIRWADEKLAVLLSKHYAELWRVLATICLYCDVKTFSLPQRFLNRVLGPVAMWAAGEDQEKIWHSG